MARGSIGDLLGNKEDLQDTIEGNRRIGLALWKKKLREDEWRQGRLPKPETWMMQGAGGGRTVTADRFGDVDGTTFATFPMFGEDDPSTPSIVFQTRGGRRFWSYGDGIWRDAAKTWPIIK